MSFMKMTPSSIAMMILAVFVALVVYNYFIPIMIAALALYFMPKYFAKKAAEDSAAAEALKPKEVKNDGIS